MPRHLPYFIGAEQTGGILVLVGISIIHIVLFIFFRFILIRTAQDMSKKLAPIILEQRNKCLGSKLFEHYFLANNGIFVTGVRHRPSSMIFAFLHSLFGYAGIVLTGINFYKNNYILAGITILIVIHVLFSDTGRWFPLHNSKANLERTIMNWKIEYPNDFSNQSGDPYFFTPLAFPYNVAKFYDSAIEISQIYFFGEIL